MQAQPSQEKGVNAQQIDALAGSHAPSEKKSFQDRVHEFERGIIAEALEEAGGSVTKAARALKLTHQGLCYIINHRHKELLTKRAPIRIRRKSIMFKGRPRRRKQTAQNILKGGSRLSPCQGTLAVCPIDKLRPV